MEVIFGCQLGEKFQKRTRHQPPFRLPVEGLQRQPHGLVSASLGLKGPLDNLDPDWQLLWRTCQLQLRSVGLAQDPIQG